MSQGMPDSIASIIAQKFVHEEIQLNLQSNEYNLCAQIFLSFAPFLHDVQCIVTLRNNPLIRRTLCVSTIAVIICW